jgi:hypothetical protein
LFIAALSGSDDAHQAEACDPAPPPNLSSRVGALPPRKIFSKLNGTYQGACKFAKKIEFVINRQALSSSGFFARLNNPVIQRNKYVPRKFTRNSVMKELVRPLYLAITSAWKE